ncbi:YdcF family protein [Allokutzneria oryzae]|uniref:YdcF family protein n=1 Tax=Allokutzneria oryzae TaxID=1378989 RepID=A0ABV6A4B9_9PSEU
MDKVTGLMTVWFGIGGLWFIAFLIGVLVDRRRLRNGVYLVISLGFFGIGALMALGLAWPKVGAALVILLFAGSPLLVVGLAVFLVLNGITMLRKEGRRLANLLSLLLGIGIFAFLLLMSVAQGSGNVVFQVAMGSVASVLFYISFVFACFLLYSIFYGRIGHRRDLDFVIVLGAGLIRGRVSALLRGRLDRARVVYDSLVAGGREPMIITSGGLGVHEERSEARAMADYLVEKGVPEDRILLEEESRTTLQNLRFSREIMVARKPDYRCVVVTSNYHVLRAALLTRRAGLNGQVVGSRTARYFWPSAILREFVAILVDNKVKNGVVCLLLALMGPLTLLVLG